MSREAMQQALEALEETTALCINFEVVEEKNGYEFTEARTVIPMGNAAIEALRAALADSAPCDSQPEPHDTIGKQLIGVIAGIWQAHPDYSIRQTLDALNVLFPAPQPEPVAFMESPYGAIRANPLYKWTLPPQTVAWSIPLYAHKIGVERAVRGAPRLSDDQIAALTIMLDQHKNDPRVACLRSLVYGGGA
jgi:hypothetical protein